MLPRYSCQRPGSVLKIVSERDLDVDRENNESEEDHPFIKGIRSANIKGELYLYRFEHDSPDNLRHFMVMDDHALRFEANHVYTRASVNFNNKKFAGICINTFDKYLVPKSRFINV